MLKQEMQAKKSLNVDWKLQQKRCLGLEGALKGESMGGFICFILFSSC